MQCNNRLRVHRGAARPYDLASLATRWPHERADGQVQRIAPAWAQRRRPRVLLADEPTTGLDDTRSEARIEVLIRAAREDAALLVIAHRDARIWARVPNAQVVAVGAGGVRPIALV